MSILAISVALATVYSPSEMKSSTLNKPDMDFEIPEAETIRRNLESSYSLDNTKALQVYEP